MIEFLFEWKGKEMLLPYCTKENKFYRMCILMTRRCWLASTWFISHKDVWTFHNKTCKKAELASFMHFFYKSETVSSLLQVKLTEHLTALLDRADGFGITPFSSSPHPSPATSLSADHCSTYFATYLKKHLWNKQIAEVSLSPLGYRSMAWQRVLILSSQEKPEPMNCSGTAREEKHQNNSRN